MEKVDNKEVCSDEKNINIVADETVNKQTPASPIVATKKRGAKKGQLTEKQKETLAKGRNKLASNWEETKKRKEELTEKYAIKKANKLIKEKLAIKKQMGVAEDDTEEEEPVKIIQPKKPKKKQTIVLPVESDSEEEIVYKKPISRLKKEEIKQPVSDINKNSQEIKQPLRIVFF